MLANYLDALLTQYGGTQKDFAHKIGVSPSTVSHWLHGAESIDLEMCLMIAAVTESSPSRLLREAGKGDIADRLEQLYGPDAGGRRSRDPALTAADRHLILLLHSLPPKIRRAVVTLVQHCAAVIALGVLT